MAVEGATPAERLAKQRRSLRKRLGMGGKLDELMETDKLIKDEDLLLAEGPTASKQGKHSTEAAELLTNMEGAPSGTPRLTPRVLVCARVGMALNVSEAVTRGSAALCAGQSRQAEA